ncbi:MAG TPA: hypothetical protein VL172_00400, partial [Kofleriaceae bacterium]|nr:hypothetical protein [Kofleriaceae bacterium]
MRRTSLILIAVAGLLAGACQKADKDKKKESPSASTSAGLMSGLFQIINVRSKTCPEAADALGSFHCELFEKEVPMTVANFVGLARGLKPWLNPATGQVEKGKPFYDG